MNAEGGSFEMTDDRLFWHLSNWSEWQKQDGVGIGYPRFASGGMGVSHGIGERFNLNVSEADARCARAVEAILEGVTPAERCAVHHVHLHAVYRFGRETSVEAAYDRAVEKVRKGLRARGIP